ncbi:dTDP-4-dehydrorhamnose reductase [Vibrio sp. 506]|uniref:dTDP-4-dehydrorhamnose reductase n=1 Tax=Vibrio sp. 506 TaxID=3074607 RepID=UPI002964DA08|nr:dTDP-4-dehydrorhamnose reductase [Vibrio sp. 506]MDW2056797.1 dTDP-4-dehydrorhamnose reductase [Vibrio sp. 506]
MKILVTGSYGQVGSCLVRQLQSMSDVEFMAVDRDELDITDKAQVESVVKEFRPDAIINAAAHTAVDKAEQEVELSYAINRDGPKNLAEAAQQIGAAILHISTDYVFAGDKEGCYVEADPVSPQGVYGQSKLAGEIEVAKACERHIILRTAWVFGEQGNNFVKTMLRLAQSRDTLGVVADQFGGPTYAGDIASTLLTIAKSIVENNNQAYGVYHYSGLPHVSWCDFAKTIFEKSVEQGCLKQAPVVNAIRTVDYPTPAKRPANSKLDTSLIKDKFGIEASDWQVALNNLTEYKGE